MEKNYKKQFDRIPYSAEHEKQQFRLVTYLDQTENDAYLLFKKMNVGTNSFHLKNALMQYIGATPQKTKINKDAIKMLGELNKLASNINQVAKHLNKGLSLDGASKIDFLKTQKDALQLISEIKAIITQ